MGPVVSFQKVPKIYFLVHESSTQNLFLGQKLDF